MKQELLKTLSLREILSAPLTESYRLRLITLAFKDIEHTFGKLSFLDRIIYSSNGAKDRSRNIAAARKLHKSLKSILSGI